MTAIVESVQSDPVRAGLPAVGAAILRRGGPVLLTVPLLVILICGFLAPILLMLLKSVEDRDLRAALPETAAYLDRWDGVGVPGEKVVAAFSAELRAVAGTPELAKVAGRLNYDISGFRSLLIKTARRIPKADVDINMDTLASIDDRWAKPEYWAAMKRATGPLTTFYLLEAVDLERSSRGEISWRSPQGSIFLATAARTLVVAGAVSIFCLLLGYPVGYLLAVAPERMTSLLIWLVLLPCWTSLLVRTAAWVILLQREGVINSALLKLGIISTPVELIYNRAGVYIVLTYTLLPYMILPLYSGMKSINAMYMRAAISLGAHPFLAFFKVYFPLSLPSVFMGVVFVFVTAIGYYITPALVGGPADQMLSYFIAHYSMETTNLGLAAALGVVLLLAVVAVVALLKAILFRKDVEWGR